MKRRDVKDKHEESVLASFESYLAQNGVTLQVINRPDPPDAIVEINGVRSWVEITDAFTSDEVARSVTSAAAEDVPHWACDKTVVLNPDESFECIFRNVIAKKINNKQIQIVSSEYGKGILLVGVYSVFHDESDMQHLVNVARQVLAENTIFDDVYLYSWGHNFHKV
ncbi:TPA: hypothetical protein PX784_003701 [Vibrio cholerae]|nr:hypothetical protein [Vibrio cholerae]